MTYAALRGSTPLCGAVSGSRAMASPSRSRRTISPPKAGSVSSSRVRETSSAAPESANV